MKGYVLEIAIMLLVLGGVFYGLRAESPRAWVMRGPVPSMPSGLAKASYPTQRIGYWAKNLGKEPRKPTPAPAPVRQKSKR